MKNKKKPPSNATLIFKVPQDLKDDLQKVSEILGKTMTDYIIDKLNKELFHFRTDNGHGKVIPIPAYKLIGISEYDKNKLILEGRTMSEGKGKKDCIVLDEVNITPHQLGYKIYDYESKSIKSIPIERIKFKDNAHE